MKRKYLLLSFAGVLFNSILLQGQITVSINPVKDNTLYQDAAGSISNGSGDHFFVGLNSINSKRRGLIQFDIASNVPAGATILEATLTLTLDQTNSGPNNVELHTVSADWGEGASVAAGGGGSGASAQTNDATWLHNFFNNSLWSTAGGDFNPNLSATTSVNGIGIYNWTSAQLVADVQGWLDSPSANFGWCITANETVPRSAMRFASKEIAKPASRPVLSIVYTVPMGIQEANSGLRGTIFPNPTSGKLQLTVHDISRAEVKIINTAGLTVCSLPLMGDQQTIDLSQQPEGVYFYELLSNHQIIETGKVIIKK